MAGTKWTHFAALGALAVAAAMLVLVVAPALGTPVLKGYQEERLTAFLHKDDADPQSQGYQLKQAVIAIGSGQKTGRGAERATQTRSPSCPRTPHRLHLRGRRRAIRLRGRGDRALAVRIARLARAAHSHQNTALYSILGVQYGGNGTSTSGCRISPIALPSAGAGPGLSPYTVGRSGGSKTVTLTLDEMPAHVHALQALDLPGQANSPAGNVFAVPRQGRAPVKRYGQGAAADLVPLHPRRCSPPAAVSPMTTCRRCLGLHFAICLYGIYPPRP